MELLSQPPLESDHLLLHGHNKTKDIPQFGKEKILSPRINLKKIVIKKLSVLRVYKASMVLP